MIPVKLSMHNFMCYREKVPPLNFDGMHLACLAGDNGNGKSSLIDAMTWALWGQARAKTDDDLIHTGQPDTEVEFEFAMGEQIYRIIRKRSRPKRQGGAGQSLLELQMATNGGFHSISGNSIAQTQQKIIDILHMDYDTFKNSAYLRQGHADEFTQQAPSKRKEVLANILGFSCYDELEARARELARQQEARKTQLSNTINDINEELVRKPDHNIELEQAQGELLHIEELIAAGKSKLDEQRQQKEALENKKVQLEQLEAKIGDTVSNLKSWEEQAEQHKSRLSEYQELIDKRAVIEECFALFTGAKRQYDELDNKFRLSVNLERQKTQLEIKITEASQSLNREHALVQRQISELEQKTEKLPDLKYRHQQLQAQLRQLTGQEAALGSQKQAVQELQTQVNYLESNQHRLEREIREITEKLDLLSTQTEARCPLCETELSSDGLKLIDSKYAAEKQEKSDSLKRNRGELTQRKAELDSRQKEILRIESHLNQENTRAQTAAGLLNKEISDSEEATTQMVEERERLTEIEERLARKDFATTEQATLIKLENELNQIGYDPEQHEQVRRSLSELEQYDQSKRNLDEADRLINQEREAVSRAEESAQRLHHSLEADNQTRQDLSAEAASLPRLLNELEQAEIEHRTLTEQQTRSQELVWQLKAKLQHCAELEKKKKDIEKQIAQTAREENIFQDLAKAFGKGGIQALLIEMALPEIEAEANRLLGRMTDNRMHVKFETQRLTKKGSVIETLDIRISDDLGTRNYEMFSGGEAFRIDFAIRIALSKLLAKRAGAPLPTLIIDEGFGTQDNTGLEKLIEAINSIQDDFDKILVITHIDELRDAFPTRIDVTKTANGSSISVS